MTVGSAGSVAGGGRVSELFDPAAWKPVDGFDDLTDVTYHRRAGPGTVRIAFHRPEVRNAFRPHTVDELYRALDHARTTPDVGCVLLTGNGPSPKDGGWAFCSGGDQRIRGRSGYQYADYHGARRRGRPARLGRLHILEVQRLIRFMPKIVVASYPAGRRVAGTACTSSRPDPGQRASTRGSSRPTPTWPASTAASGRPSSPARSGRSSPGRSSSLGRAYDAEEAHRMGMVNAVVAHADLERVALVWAREINGKSPTALRMLKYAFNAVDDGLVGQQLFAGEATRLAYMTDEAREGRDAFLEKRPPDWSDFPFYY